MENLLKEIYKQEKARAMPDLEITHCGYTVHQTYAFTNGKYGRWWYDIDGKFIMHSLGDYMTEDELKEECEHMKEFLKIIEEI